MRRKRHLRHGVWAVALCAVLVYSAPTSHADEFYPGLPDSDGSYSVGFTNLAQSGLSYAKRAKQWFRAPDGIVAANTGVGSGPRVEHPDGSATARHWTDGAAYFVSPAGAPENYGYLAPMKVRSVGFGLMPVEATVQVSQRRKNGYPVPLKARVDAIFDYHPVDGHAVSLTSSDTVVKDAVNVRILDVRVDGVDLELTGNCRTVKPAPFTVVGPGYIIPEPHGEPGAQEKWFLEHDPSEYYNPLYGGTLEGSMTIPAFTGCTTASGDDLSALMTLSVSGPGNPVSARNGWPCTISKDNFGFWPAAPGQTTPKSLLEDARPSGNRIPDTARGCNGSKPFSYPERPAD